MKKLLMAAMLMALMACAGKDNLASDILLLGVDDSQMSPQQRELAQRQIEYAQVRLVATGVGTATGVVACNAALGDECGKTELLVSTLAGGAVGYLGGSLLTRDNESFQNSQLNLQESIAAAEKLKDEQNENVAVAQAALTYHKRESKRINNEFLASDVQKGEYRNYYALLQNDITRVNSMQVSEAERIAKLKQNLPQFEKDGQSDAEVGELRGSIQKLERDRTRLQERKNSLQGIMDSAPTELRQGVSI